jgi:hypothetical protein
MTLMSSAYLWAKWWPSGIRRVRDRSGGSQEQVGKTRDYRGKSEGWMGGVAGEGGTAGPVARLGILCPQSG